MFKIHLKIFWRQLQRNIFYVVINVLGLSFATTLSMFIFIHCWHELTYDKFHKNYKNIYLLKMDYLSNNEVIFNMYPPTPIYEALNQQFSEVEYASRVYVSKNMILNINSENYDVGNLLTIDPMFFDMFSYKLQQGQSKSIFSNSKEIIISTHIAKKYFNNENAIGKTVVLQGYGEYLITGVIEVPSNSSLQFDFIKSTQPSDQITWKFGVVAPIYFTSKSIRQVEQTVQILQTSINDHYGEGNFKLEAVPLSEQYFNSKIDFSLHGSIQYVWIFISLGIGILSLSILNYINLTLPQAFKRSKDVGIRTIVGANRLQLILQIIFETLILIILSIFLSLVFITILTPTFKSLIGKEISLDVFQLNELVVFGLLFTTILISSCGIYPALHLTSISPTVALKKKTFIKGIGNLWIRNGVISFQFTITIIAIVMVLVMNSQLEFIKNESLGFTKEHILRIKIPSNNGLPNSAVQNYNILKNQILQLKDVQSVSVSSMPYYDASFEGIYYIEGEEKSTPTFILKIDEDFINLTGIQLISGRNFTESDTKDGIIINETASKLFFDGDPIGNKNKMISKKTVIGVVKDFYFRGKNLKIEPLILEYYNTSFQGILIKLKTANTEETISSIQKIWKTHVDDLVFDYRFLDEEYQNLYFNEIRTSKIFSIFSITSIFIACLGLVGVSSYTLNSLQTSLSIRKLFGASRREILKLMLNKILTPIFVAFGIALPISLELIKLYLESFETKIEFFGLQYLKATAIVLLLALGSILAQLFHFSNKPILPNLKEE